MCREQGFQEQAVQGLVVLCAQKQDTYEIWLPGDAEVCITLLNEPPNELSIETDDFDAGYEPELLQVLEETITKKAEKCRAVSHARTATAAEMAGVGQQSTISCPYKPPPGLTLPEAGTFAKSVASVDLSTSVGKTRPVGCVHPAQAAPGIAPHTGGFCSSIPNLALNGSMSGLPQPSLNVTGMTTAKGLASAIPPGVFVPSGVHAQCSADTAGTRACEGANGAPAAGGTVSSTELSKGSSNDKDNTASGKEDALPRQVAPPAFAGTLAAQFSSKGVTTLMLRNLPFSVTQKRLIEELTATGFTGLFDFCYMPSLFGSGVGKGYAFVNLISTDAVGHFVNTWHGSRRFGLQTSDAAINVSAACLQGREKNAKKWDAPRMRRVRNPALRPLVLGSPDTTKSDKSDTDTE